MGRSDLKNANAAPIEKLVNAILLSAIKKQASGIRIGRDPAGEAIVQFAFASAYRDPEIVEEMRPPTLLLSTLVRRLAVMAYLPNNIRTGTITLQIGGNRRVQFAITIEGRGDDLSARLDIVKNERI